jgi:hypothetical protein
MDSPFVQSLKLAELQEAEILRWRVIRNEALPDFQWEVCRDDDEGNPIMVVGCRSEETAWTEHEEQAAVAGIKAVLAAAKKAQR